MTFRRTLVWLLAATLLLTGVALVVAQRLFAEKKFPSLHQNEALQEWEAEVLLNDPRYAQQFIRTGPAEPVYNCHGWTFTGGKRSVPNTEVQRRISSSHYQRIATPEPEDIVIYYDAHGDICHSGIIKATGKKGFVLVESKWGELGRFLHLLDAPQVQVSYEFYRHVPYQARMGVSSRQRKTPGQNDKPGAE